MAAADNVALAPHYYRDNFLALCASVEQQYGDVLTAAEHDLLRSYRELGFDAQCLYVRLVSRVGPWFRESKLSYPELGSIADCVDELLAAGLAEQAEGLSLAELGALFTRAELAAAAGALLDGPAPRTKPELLAALEQPALDNTEHLQLAAVVDSGRIVAAAGLAEVELFQLLFFGNRHQGLTDFVLSDLGVARYYPYSLDREQRLFPHRGAVEEYLACAALGDSWYQLQELGEPADLVDMAAQLASLSVEHASSESRWHRLCNSVARDMERLGEPELAARLYSLSGRHPARERRLRILERLEDWRGALDLAGTILASPWCEEERDAAARVLPRVQRRLGRKPMPRRRDQFTRLDLVLAPGAERVEVLAARQLESQWAAVHYVENTLMNTLFGLAFWEQIFTAVPGAFHNPYQSVPADMYSREFQQRRRAALERRLEELRGADISALLRRAYQRYAGFQCRWVDWRRVDEALLAAAVDVIPGEHLLAIWERMLFDPRENRRGFPDLVALGEARGDYCLVEVKGPGDALQESQKRWLRFFVATGIPAAVAWVAWE
ncbi:MAG: VRR-NUC domain-containing protein [Pseudomonadales bacterium]|nr:VRR-NUC domain-containing protein [Pseudomonadales bacterium]